MKHQAMQKVKHWVNFDYTLVLRNDHVEETNLKLKLNNEPSVYDILMQ